MGGAEISGPRSRVMQPLRASACGSWHLACSAQRGRVFLFHGLCGWGREVGRATPGAPRPLQTPGLRIMTAGIGSWLWPVLFGRAVSVLWARPEPWVRSAAPACPELAESLQGSIQERLGALLCWRQMAQESYRFLQLALVTEGRGGMGRRCRMKERLLAARSQHHFSRYRRLHQGPRLGDHAFPWR